MCALLCASLPQYVLCQHLVRPATLPAALSPAPARLLERSAQQHATLVSTGAQVPHAKQTGLGATFKDLVVGM
jgi:hypothetical protein